MTVKRQRSQVGQRISSTEPAPARPTMATHCPCCGRKSSVSQIIDADVAPWIELEGLERYPRKPDGTRGFSYERLAFQELLERLPEAREVHLPQIGLMHDRDSHFLVRQGSLVGRCFEIAER